MRFIIGGRHIDLNALGDPLDQKFIDLHAAYFAHHALNLTDFEAATIKWLDSLAKQTLTEEQRYSVHDAYFGNYTVIWNNFLSSGNFDEAERIWNMALAPVLKWEDEDRGKRIHKGTAYYFWAMTVLKRGDIDRGYVLMHKGVEEDIRTLGPETATTKPGFAFISLNYAKTVQAFRSWVIDQVSFLNELQNRYSELYGREFILEDFRRKFLSSSRDIEALSLFAYTVARLKRVSQLPREVLQIPFAGQLEINILFDIILVIDAAIRIKNATKWQFVDHAIFLLSKAGSRLTKKELQEINAASKKNIDSTLQSLIDGNYTFINGRRLTRLGADVAFAYVLRNHGAHDVSAVSVISDRFTEVEQMIMNVLFASVDYLY
jgi:hypothetical protein